MPVNQMISRAARLGLPRERSSSRSTAHGKTLVVLSTPTSAIMANSSRMTLRSTACWAASNEISLNGEKYEISQTSATAPIGISTRCTRSAASSANTPTRIAATMPWLSASRVESKPWHQAR